MKRLTRSAKAAPMSADEFAGFLKLWLTPAGQERLESPEVRAYLRRVGERAPLSATARRALGQPTKNAA
jgi:4-alpha-glucanotransferase